ncbi:AmpG permease [hydrothermal vent metagenome]|uniref:AmpG permease n=1 Tax=hydrothermal vent metagenome TaxID=652676 RepID=A0A3B0YBH2_9ZZZZ
MSDQQQRRDWGSAFSVYANPRVMGMMFLGFSAGLPLMLIFGNLATWLTDIRIPIFIIGFFGWISLTYSIKVFWAPIIDIVNIPYLSNRLGHRRSWMLAAQIGIAIGIYGLSAVDPHNNLWLLAWFGLLTAFCSATQDICVDAYRIEAVPNEYQAAMASTYIFGYRLAVVVSGAGVLMISEFSSWSNAYFTMALLMSVGIITTLIIQEPVNRAAKKSMPVALVKQHMKSFGPLPETVLTIVLIGFSLAFGVVLLGIVIVFPVFIPIILWALYRYRNRNVYSRVRDWYIGAVVGPIVDFVYRFGFKLAMMILGLIMIYRISDLFMGFMAYTLYIELGFTKIEIAIYTKVFGIIMTLLGTIMGGVMVMRYGVMRIMLLGAVMVASTNLLFSVLAMVGHNIPMLILLIIGDNISSGVATAAFIAYLSSLVNKQYTATQYALFSSLMLFLGKMGAGFSGQIVAGVGFSQFFYIAAATGIPTIILIIMLMRMGHEPKPHEVEEDIDLSQEKQVEQPIKAKKHMLLAYMVIPIVLGAMVVLVLFERGIFQFNNPDQTIYTSRGVTISPNKKICWERLNEFRWDDAGKRRIDFMYFVASKGVEVVQQKKTMPEKKIMAQKPTVKQKKKVKMCKLANGTEVRYTRGLTANWTNAVKHHYRVGAVHVFDLCAKGLLQARHMIKKAPRKVGALPPVIAIELVGNCPIHKQPGLPVIISEIKIMALEIQKYYGTRPILMGTDKAYAAVVRESFTSYKFWVNSIIKVPLSKEVGDWLLWQYSARIPIEGISGYSKASLIKGNKAALNSL